MTEQPGDETTAATPPLAPTTDPAFAQDGSEYNSSGRTVVKTRFPYEFASSDQSLPVITVVGTKMTKTQADAVLAEAATAQAADIVFIAEEED